MVKAHAAIWKEKGLLTRNHSPTEHGPEILQLLEAIHLPKAMAIIPCRGYQKALAPIAQGTKGGQASKSSGPQGAISKNLSTASLL